MRISSLMAVLTIGILALTNVALAKPILDFQHESVFKSTFCQNHGCQFVNSSFDRSDGIDFEQYLYKLNNSLYFVAARFPSQDKKINRYDYVSSVSLMARATIQNLKKLEEFLPIFIGETAVGHRIDFQYNFKQKCARAAEKSYRGDGLLEVYSLPVFKISVLGGYILEPNNHLLTIICKAQEFDILSITLYWGEKNAQQNHSSGFNCSNPFLPMLPNCSWSKARTKPRRIF